MSPWNVKTFKLILHRDCFLIEKSRFRKKVIYNVRNMSGRVELNDTNRSRRRGFYAKLFEKNVYVS